MHILIVDDELLARNRLRVLLSESEDPSAPFTIEEAANVAQALEFVHRSPLPVDLVLLDIQMPGPDGMVLAQTLRNLPKPPAIVFVTAHSMYAASAFEVEAIDYLTKPVRLERLQQAIAKLRRIRALEGTPSSSESAPALVIRDRGRAERVPLHQVVYLKAEQKYVTVRTASRTYILDNSLSELEQRYPGQFLRLHRNALVNPSQMRMLEKQYTDEEGECWAMRLHSVPEMLQVSRRQLSAVRSVLQGTRRPEHQQTEPA
ncbi:LytR/AlgR family response regulator transcription factor [Comamonas aquatica]|uniref:LytR/AlgR family response regulator transcription factor n=1 Tax=Comamonas aquatica TaxID=225991 RepID=UPI001B3849ED|nr:LytTR family DNA-binding domain-containing protein [Comamonas aquatica]MDH0200576.1 LytTR family DNA-binding domain-containing protein [Comamonas aquatica]MDH0381503.1 LytTR family DNA-binding domain-containing protein [Comamonas aquatica]MDH0429432.1 LytTR family DNA-binding domain-containing protein [Comamonas aquatica]MDH0939876.1 LytTR family DNA-binding domain-containing protein [Comamonas aquatica]MDH1379554.1 LytTR family DNA-binding domain-containing protein [Comamonas aquatica]